MFSSVFCSQSIIFRPNRSICGKGHPALMEPSGYFGCAVFHRHMDILRHGGDGIYPVCGSLSRLGDSGHADFYAYQKENEEVT